MKQMTCKICGSDAHSILYRGPIRMGKFGQFSPSHHTIWSCNDCRVGFLSRPPLEYQSSAYRETVDGGHSPEHFYEKHDAEQAEKLKILGTDGIRQRVIADIGCGAGAFLDLVSGFAAKTIGVEPMTGYHTVLSEKGHQVYPCVDPFLDDWAGKIDVALCFLVLEHLENPVGVLRDIRKSLRPGGFLLLSTPNADNWLLEFLPETYGRFFYRFVHTWYFNRKAVDFAARAAGFHSVTVKYVQEFDLSNALLWVRDGRPTGCGKFSLFRQLDPSYRQLAEEGGRSDFLYAWLYNQ